MKETVKEVKNQINCSSTNMCSEKEKLREKLMEKCKEQIKKQEQERLKEEKAEAERKKKLQEVEWHALRPNRPLQEGMCPICRGDQFLIATIDGHDYGKRCICLEKEIEMQRLQKARKKIEFVVKGEPQGKGRPRFANHGKYISVWTPNKTMAYENQIKFAYYKQCGKVKFSENSQLELLVKAYLKVPQNGSKKKKAAMLSGEIRPTKKPDADNILKVVADALNGVCYKDDKCLVKMSAEKFYSDVPRIEVVVQEIKEN